ncbi:hypothetical protein V3330_17055 [Wenzhouxiangellaceae bacterium CH-27]|uniref:Peptidase C-terminal archaeal/bacterial domain-containing protein n=1 Tax=Elongatibacter sediminis TaxID=3119006 RepID=A0AAW9R8V7_9GAMM
MALAGILAPTAGWSANSVLSGEFDGSEAVTSNLPGTCSTPKQLPYQQVSFQVGANGEYDLFDAFNFNGVDISAQVYQGTFNPGNPTQNLLTPDGVDSFGSVNLSAGTNYVLVVQQWCEAGEGAWVVTFAGPGAVSANAVRDVPEFTSGSFTGSEPNLDSVCGNTPYIQSGPVRVSRPGTYYYTDISIAHDVDMCLQVFSAPVNTGNPTQNRIAFIDGQGGADDFGAIELQAGQDYYFVVQPLNTGQTGEFFFVFAPPASFRLNHGMAGSWFNPATGGQGFFLDVFDNINQLFLAWFSYDLSRPDNSVTAQIGDPGHRWLTAFGPFSGGTADLDIEWTTGGVFDASSPAPAQSVDGSIQLDFTDCLSGTVTYDLGTANVSGVVPIQRIANDAVTLCESTYQGPGMPDLL